MSPQQEEVIARRVIPRRSRAAPQRALAPPCPLGLDLVEVPDRAPIHKYGVPDVRSGIDTSCFQGFHLRMASHVSSWLQRPSMVRSSSPVYQASSLRGHLRQRKQSLVHSSKLAAPSQ